MVEVINAVADVKQAEGKVLSFIKWHDQNNVIPHHVEKQRVSEHFKYGGTTDFDGLVNNELFIIDYKSGGKEIYPEAWVQGMGNVQLYLEEHGVSPNMMVLKLGDNGAYQQAIIDHPAKYWNIFYHLREIYKTQKELNL